MSGRDDDKAICMQWANGRCGAAAVHVCFSCEKPTCARHRRFSPLSFSLYLMHVNPMIDRSCITCFWLEQWAGIPANSVGPDLRRAFFISKDGAMFAGEWDWGRLRSDLAT